MNDSNYSYVLDLRSLIEGDMCCDDDDVPAPVYEYFTSDDTIDDIDDPGESQCNVTEELASKLPKRKPPVKCVDEPVSKVSKQGVTNTKPKQDSRDTCRSQSQQFAQMKYRKRKKEIYKAQRVEYDDLRLDIICRLATHHPSSIVTSIERDFAENTSCQYLTFVEKCNGEAPSRNDDGIGDTGDEAKSEFDKEDSERYESSDKREGDTTEPASQSEQRKRLNKLAQQKSRRKRKEDLKLLDRKIKALRSLKHIYTILDKFRRPSLSYICCPENSLLHV